VALGAVLVGSGYAARLLLGPVIDETQPEAAAASLDDIEEPREPEDPAVAAPPVTPGPAEAEPSPEESFNSIVDEGDDCRIEQQHACAVEHYARAYWMSVDSDSTHWPVHSLVDLTRESCIELTRQPDFEAHEAAIESCIDVTKHYLNERDRWSKHRHSRIARPRDLRNLLSHLQNALHVLHSLKPPPAPTGDGFNASSSASMDKAPSPGDDRTRKPLPAPAPPSPDPRDVIIKRTRPAIIGGTIIVVAGGLLALTATSLIVDGSAWTQCNRKYRDREGRPSDRCVDLLGAKEGLNPGTIFTPNVEIDDAEYDVAERNARANAVRSWVLGSVGLAVAGGMLTAGSVLIRNARKERRKFAVHASLSRHDVAVGFTTRF